MCVCAPVCVCASACVSGCLFVSVHVDVQEKEHDIPSCGVSESKMTNSCHTPRGFSAHEWVVMNGHLLNPSIELSSFGLLLRIIDLHNVKGDVIHMVIHSMVCILCHTSWRMGGGQKM